MKRILSFVSGVGLVLGLAACASEPGGETVPDAAAPAQTAQTEGPVRNIVNVTGDLYRAQNNNHATVFLVTPEGIILADPINRDFANWLRAEFETRFQLPVRYVLYSHSHWDHASGGEVFADTAEFVGHESMPGVLAPPSADMPLPANAAGMDANQNGGVEMAEATGNFRNNFRLFDANEDGMLSGAEIARGPLNDVYPPTETYADRTTLTLGGKNVEMIHPGPAHSPDTSIVYFPEESAVFVVDFIMLKQLPFQNMDQNVGMGSSFDVWVSAMRDVEALGADIVIPGHGVVGTTADVADHRQYVEELRQAVAQGVAAGQSLPELQETLLMEDYRDWGNYDQWRALNIQGMYESLTR